MKKYACCSLALPRLSYSTVQYISKAYNKGIGRPRPDPVRKRKETRTMMSYVPPLPALPLLPRHSPSFLPLSAHTYPIKGPPRLIPPSPFFQIKNRRLWPCGEKRSPRQKLAPCQRRRRRVGRGGGEGQRLVGSAIASGGKDPATPQAFARVWDSPMPKK